MKRARRAVAVVAVVVAMIGGFTGYVHALSGDNANTRGIIAFVGDSNIELADNQIGAQLADGTHLNNSYVPILLHRAGSGIRTSDCMDNACGTYNYWNLKLTPLWAKLKVDAIVVDLGINDATHLGRPDGPGYQAYAQKIDWMMNQFPPGVPVYWTDLPCSIEPAALVTGCQKIDMALTAAASNWPNLTVLPWSQTAQGHTEYMLWPGVGVHYAFPGVQAWTNLVLTALDTRFP